VGKQANLMFCINTRYGKKYKDKGLIVLVTDMTITSFII